jgi:hypothetical protein
MPMKRAIPLFLSVLLFPLVSFSTHMRGGQIRVIPKSNPLVCTIEITAYTNTGSEIRFGEGQLDFGDGSPVHVPPNIPNIGRPDIGDAIGYVKYTVEHTYDELGAYLITYNEPNLNDGILNMPRSVETAFYIETFIMLTDDGAFTSADFPAAPIFVFQSGLDYSFSTAAVDNSSNEFYYTYSLITNPKKASGQVIDDYDIPDNLKINRYNGIVTWDTQYHDQFFSGMIWIVVKIDKYRSTGEYLGYVARAMQIIVEDGLSEFEIDSSFSDQNGKIVVRENEQTVVQLLLSDANDYSHEYDFEFDMFISDKIKDNVVLTQYDSVASSNLQRFRVGKLSFNTTTEVVSDMPYTVLIRGKAHSNSGNPLILKDVAFLYMTKDKPLPGTPKDTDVVTAVIDEKKKAINVYPNPFRSELYVDGTEAIFINNVGQTVMTSRLQKGKPVNTSVLPAGFYVLKVVGDDGLTRSVKVVRN